MATHLKGNEMAESDIAAIDEETIEMLDGQVKKGKARKFFLIYKGASIKTLVVFKKGPFGPKIMKAKKNGFKGDVAYGIVTGSGKNLSFQLPANGEVAAAMKVDSWEDKPPAKTAKLREFLTANGLKFKPTFEMVTEVGDALDPDVEADIPDAPPLPGDDQSVPPPPPGDDKSIPDAPAPPDAAALSFMQLLKKLKPDMTKVIGAGVSVSQDVKLRASEAAVFARKKEFDAGLEILGDVEELIKKGLAEISATGGGSDGDRAELAADFKTRLQSLVPQIKAAIGTPAGDAAKLKASEAGTFARKADFTQAIALLDEVEELLKQSAPGEIPKAPPLPGSDLAAVFKTRLTALVPQIKQAVGTPAGDAAKLKASEAGTFARKQDFEQANALLDEAETLLRQPVSDTTEPLVDGATDAPGETDQSAELREAIDTWKSAQSSTVTKLKVIEKKIAAANHPDTMKALIELKAVISQLAGTPDTTQKVSEMERYLEQDDVVQDVCELAEDIRTPLLAATVRLKAVVS
jgi:cellobiose-specific phosphotransferase system component IIA